jgi:hypothetical protein
LFPASLLSYFPPLPSRAKPFQVSLQTPSPMSSYSFNYFLWSMQWCTLIKESSSRASCSHSKGQFVQKPTLIVLATLRLPIWRLSIPSKIIFNALDFRMRMVNYWLLKFKHCHLCSCIGRAHEEDPLYV